VSEARVKEKKTHKQGYVFPNVGKGKRKGSLSIVF